MLPGLEMMACTELAVPAEVMHHVVHVESSFNPYAIGVVGGRLARQPKNLAEALSTARMLEREGYNFSLGMAQVNRHNLAKQGLDSYEKAFNVCPNLQAGARILAECYGRSGNDWGKAFSCYYSGNFTTGFRHGYVDKVMTSWRGRTVAAAGGPAGMEIPVIRARQQAAPARRYQQPVESTTSRVLRRIEEAALSAAGLPPVPPEGYAVPQGIADPQQQNPPGIGRGAPPVAAPDMTPYPQGSGRGAPPVGGVAADAPVRVQPMGAPPIAWPSMTPPMTPSMTPSTGPSSAPAPAAHGAPTAPQRSRPVQPQRDEAYVF